MNNEFILTTNVSLFGGICDELVDPSSTIGPSLAMVTGPAGRGKSEAAKHYAIQTDTVYIPPFIKTSPMMLLQEICFDLCKLKPGRIAGCLEVISDEMERERRLVIIDEADLLPMPILEMLRNVNERYGCPVLLIGEDGLKGRVASRRRIGSRIRRSMSFDPVSQADIVLFFKKNLSLQLESEQTAMIFKHCQGDWRPILTTALSIERAMKASGLNTLPVSLLKDVIDGKNA